MSLHKDIMNICCTPPADGEMKGAVVDRLECVLELTRETLEGIIKDAEDTYTAAKTGRPIEISIGQFRRLEKAKTRLRPPSQQPADKVDAQIERSFTAVEVTRITQDIKAQRDAWQNLFRRVSKELNCLPSLFFDGNEHVIKAAQVSASALVAAQPDPAMVGDDDDGMPVGYPNWYNQQFFGQHVDTQRDHYCESAWRAALARKRVLPASVIVGMVDAAMVEMKNVSPPMRRSECERLIRAALKVQPARWEDAA